MLSAIAVIRCGVSFDFASGVQDRKSNKSFGISRGSFPASDWILKWSFMNIKLLESNDGRFFPATFELSNRFFKDNPTESNE